MSENVMNEIRLSRRNLMTLLHKLEMTGSERTIIKPCGDVDLVVIAEHDEDHYHDRRAGRVHPDTEEFISEWEKWRTSRAK